MLRKLKLNFQVMVLEQVESQTLLFFSIQVLSNENSLSCNDLQTVAIVKCDENYDNLRSTCKPLFE